MPVRSRRAEPEGGSPAGSGVQLGFLDGLVGYHMRRASSIMRGDYRRALVGTGIRQVLFAILSLVKVNPGINQGAVGRVLAIKRANMVALINELVADGFVLRMSAPSDRRAFALQLTDAGRAEVTRNEELIAAHEDVILGVLSARERATLLKLLSRIEAQGVEGD